MSFSSIVTTTSLSTLQPTLQRQRTRCRSRSLGERSHHAVFHQALDDLCAGFHTARQLADGDLIGDLDGQRVFLAISAGVRRIFSAFIPACACRKTAAGGSFCCCGIFCCRSKSRRSRPEALGCLGAFVVLIEVDVRYLAGVDDLLSARASWDAAWRWTCSAAGAGLRGLLGLRSLRRRLPLPAGAGTAAAIVLCAGALFACSILRGLALFSPASSWARTGHRSISIFT